MHDPVRTGAHPLCCPFCEGRADCDSARCPFDEGFLSEGLLEALHRVTTELPEEEFAKFAPVLREAELVRADSQSRNRRRRRLRRLLDAGSAGRRSITLARDGRCHLISRSASHPRRY